MNRKFLLTTLSLIIGLTSLLTAKELPRLEERLKKLGLVNIQSLHPDIMVDLKYSSKDNFIKKDVYGDLNSCYLQKKIALRAAKAQKLLSKLRPGYRLLIFDCVRPNSVQIRMWNIVKNTPARRYVANPKYGSIHSYGSAIDLTIIDAQGNPLDMGTPFDFFGKLAQPRYEKYFYKKGKLSLKALRNRQLLRKVMHRFGFKVISNEWWHFNGFPRKVVKKKYKMVP